MKNKLAKPFLKWAGGKGQLLEKFKSLYPEDLVNGKIKTYIEPFIGGGAVLFEVLQNYDIDKAVIVDLNKELINCYKCIKFDVEKLINQLYIVEHNFLSLSIDDRKEYYLKTRNKYNSIILNGMCDIEKACDFIFLNRTCYNGLYRVNNKGEFNVPFGKYKNPVICDKENLFTINKLLKKVEILYGDYSICEDYLDNASFIYFDPPYRPLVDKGSFTKYSKNGFDDCDQVMLAQFFKKISNKCKIMLSNSDPKNVNESDSFFDDLYMDYEICRVKAKRMINCQSNNRGDVTEIVVRNYRSNE